MSDSFAVSVRQVSKCYQLYERPGDRLKQSVLRHFGKRYGHEFRALNEVSFEVRPGETFGIIGRNGSGKSTLLEIIAGTLAATAGEIRVNGRVGALLELGSGFSPEYTGRENVFMNGVILGIPKKEMERRLEEIIAFADIGEFIDQPVKIYSSGMLLRLAFAITVGLDADVLLIDEALAVGDIFFRQKCYQRLERLRERGVSIILVSHAMTEVEQFCKRALLLHQGHMIFLGSGREAVKKYYLMQQQETLSPPNLPGIAETAPARSDPRREEDESFFWPEGGSFLQIRANTQISNGRAQGTAVALCNPQGQPCLVFQQGEMASFFFEFAILQDMQIPIGGLILYNEKGIIIHGKNTLLYGTEVPPFVRKGTRLRFRQDIFLEIAAGDYTFEIGLATMPQTDFAQRGSFSVEDLGTRVSPLCTVHHLGPFAVVPRLQGDPVRLLHHGAANLRGNCQIYQIPASGGDKKAKPN